MKNHDDNSINHSANRPFADVLQKYLSRRDALKGGVAAAAATGFLASTPKSSKAFFGPTPAPLMDFQPVTLADAAAGDASMPLISPDYEYQVLLSWGDPINPSAGPAFRYPPTSAEQAQQVGIGHDGMTFFPKRTRRWGRYVESNTEGYLVFNCEYGGNDHIFGTDVDAGSITAEQVLTSQHAHGVTVVEIAKTDEGWQVVDSPNARRIHVNTEMAFSGPVAGSPLLDNPAGNTPMGTANNCANGQTPWGTYLTCEENFNGYFGTADGGWTQGPADQKYGLSAGGFGYYWHIHDDRFDLANPDYVNERNRFGWVVEIDPLAPTSTPVKRTALGRFKHEGAEVTVGRGGRVVVYMGDDEVNAHFYKFVSRRNYRAMQARGQSPLDEGTLYVAKFNDDGTGEWMPLTLGNSDVAGASFGEGAEAIVLDSMDKVLTYARFAAEAAGATPMDRPEWASVAPDGWVYLTLTNNSGRSEPGPANPLAPNPDGHIVRVLDDADHTGTHFEWEIFLIAEETHGTEESFSDPDGIYADPDGRIFIETDGGQKDGLQDQLLVADSMTGEVRRLFMGVSGDEITGFAYTPDHKTVFVNIQHPGDGSPANTSFPAPPDGVTVPRDSTVVITRKNGGVVGS